LSSVRDDDALARLTALLREQAEAQVPASVDEAGKLALARRLRHEAAASGRRTRPFLLLAAALVSVTLVGFVALRPRPLEYAVRGAPSAGPYISAKAGAKVTVSFSDGSSLVAEPGARLRVDEARVAGARVLLERGRTLVHVRHESGSAWNFVAGPFDVRVTGTRFELSWDPASEALDLELSEGSVEVKSPLSDSPIVVRAGQRFRADLASRSLTVMDARSDGVSAEPPAQSPGAVAPPTEKSGASAREPARAVPGELAPAAPLPSSVSTESWSTLVARGQFETVVAKAGERGTTECESSCAAADLRALADAARYTGRSAMAGSALLSLRRRFGGTREGRSAAFLLGRLDEARGAMSEAGRWYDAYLRELPAGDLAAEALAGKMRTVFASGGRAAAEPLATEYLARYPNGVHAQTARGILAGPARR
jgi:hypothetical protein